MSFRARVSDEERADRIRSRIREAERAAVERHPLLRHRDAIALTALVASTAGMTGLGALYWAGFVPFWLCLLGNAFFASILHELEHDLIHFLYFKTRPLAHDAMMLIVWVLRGNVIHGWYRRRIHFHHHRASGTKTDVEERLLGLGMPWGTKRVVVMVDGAMAFLLNAKLLSDEIPGFRRRELAWASVPVYPVFASVLVSFVVFHALLTLDAVGLVAYTPSAWFVALYPLVDVLAVAWVFPNYLRQAALSIVSSNVHYYEDVRGIQEETQVLRPFYFWPLQLLCFNFGTTHSFHHYVVEQPFYIRQLIAPAVLPAMRENGVRFNDTGTFRRANRYRVLTNSV